MSPRHFAFWNKWDPGAMTPQRGHTDDRINFSLSGEICCGDLVCGAGTHVLLEWGDMFGPWEAGPEAYELYGFMAGEGSPFPSDPAPCDAPLAARSALPVPMPTRLPPWANAEYSGSVTNWADGD
jgi:hypothetical protein